MNNFKSCIPRVCTGSGHKQVCEKHDNTLRLAPLSQQYTGITPYYGADTYQYLQMAMGLSISPAIWQTFINNILRQIPNKNRYCNYRQLFSTLKVCRSVSIFD